MKNCMKKVGNLGHTLFLRRLLIWHRRVNFASGQDKNFLEGSMLEKIFCSCCDRTHRLTELPPTRSSEELKLTFFECQCGNTLSVETEHLKAIAIVECEYCDQEATITEPTGIKVCEDCHNDCPHDDIECGECQECGRHISDFMDEDYGRER